MFNQSLILPCCVTHMSWNVLNAVSINSSLRVLVTYRNKRCQWFQSFCPSSSHLTDYLVSQCCLCLTESVCASTVGSFPLKSRPEQWREAMRTAAKHSNINSTVHITYQLVGRSMFLHGGHHSFVRGGQCFLVGPALPFENEQLYRCNHNISKLLCRNLWPLSTCVASVVFHGSGAAGWYGWSPAVPSGGIVSVGHSKASLPSCMLSNSGGMNAKTFFQPKGCWSEADGFIKSNKSQQQNWAGFPFLICPHACCGAHVKSFVVMA